MLNAIIYLNARLISSVLCADITKFRRYFDQDNTRISANFNGNRLYAIIYLIWIRKDRIVLFYVYHLHPLYGCFYLLIEE